MSSARRLIILYISITFHENILNGFQVIERTGLRDGRTDRRSGHEFTNVEFQREIQCNSKTVRTRLRFLCSARRLMMLYISVKLHENILNGFQVILRTGLRDGRTERRSGHEFTIVEFQREITQKLYGQELRFLYSARRLMML